MKSRVLSVPPRERTSRPRMLVVTEKSDLELLSDKAGSIAFGWLAPTVLYTRFRGGFTAKTGHAYATRLGVLIALPISVCFFCDMSELRYYDFLARSAIVRAILLHRRKFSSITLLASAEGNSPAIRDLAAIFGNPIQVVTNRKKFEGALLKKAPLAFQKIDRE